MNILCLVRKNTRSWFQDWWVFLLPIAALFVGLAVVSVYAKNSDSVYTFLKSYLQLRESAQWGQFGDFVGGVMNPLISLMTLVVAALVWKLQKKELKETKDTLQRQLEIDVIFRQLQLHQSLVENLEFNDQTGRKVFKQLSPAIWSRISTRSAVEAAVALTFRDLDWTSLNDIPIPQATEDAVQKPPEHLRYVHDFLKCYEEGVLNSTWLDSRSERDVSWTIESILGHYFRSVFAILQSVQQSRFLSKKEKDNLIEALRAQLSEDEFVILAANCSTKRGRKFRAQAILCDFFHSRLTIHPIGRTFIQSLSPTEANTTWAKKIVIET
jgi:hypothetical protein